MESIKIIVADDHPLFREGLKQALLRIQPTFNIFIAANGNEAIETLEAEAVDLIFLDIRMPGRDGIEITKCIRKFNTTVKIVVVSMIDDRISIMKIFKAGANGFLHKNTDICELHKVIEIVCNGVLFIRRNCGV
ncbi:MAG: response regulator transcription factor [Bacteroidetes bacterium]|nr:response regulator transcription factor [Bacteroidota bacterium]